MEIRNVSDATFETEVLKSDLPVLVDFWAEWCASCLGIGLIVEEIAQTYEGRLKVVKLNVEESMKTPARFGIRSLPALLFVKDGEVKETLFGSQSRGRIIETIKKVL